MHMRNIGKPYYKIIISDVLIECKSILFFKTKWNKIWSNAPKLQSFNDWYHYFNILLISTHSRIICIKIIVHTINS